MELLISMQIIFIIDIGKNVHVLKYNAYVINYFAFFKLKNP